MGDASIFRRFSSKGQTGSVVTRLQQVPNGGDLDQNQPGRSSVNLRVKSVIVGDSSVGKTSLVVSYSTNGYPTEYVPTAFDNYSVLVTVDNKPVHLQLCDTGGQEDFASLRALCYPHTDVFILCFSVVCPTSFAHIKEKWLPEIQAYRSNQEPIILVGNQCDLRSDVKTLISLSQRNNRPVSIVQAQALCRQIGGSAYVECSALTQRNLKEVFDAALLAALQNRSNQDGSIVPVATGESSNKRSNSCCSFVKDKAFNWRKLCCF